MEVGYVIWGTRFQASLCPAKLGLQMSLTCALTLCMTLFRHKKTAFDNFMPLSQNDRGNEHLRFSEQLGNKNLFV